MSKLTYYLLRAICVINDCDPFRFANGLCICRRCGKEYYE